MKETLSDAVKEQIPEIDEIMAARQVNLLMRPHAAAMFFVEECIVSINGDTKENYLEKPWFAEIYQAIYKWYLERYGDRLRERPQQAATGMVVLFGTLFKVEVPLVTDEPADDPSQKWILFPDSVQANEDPLHWLTAAPNLENIPSADLATLERDVRWVADTVRTLKRDFSTATLEDENYKQLAIDVPIHMSVGARHVLEGQGAGHLAIWEWQMAIEKALKTYLRQQGEAPPYKHDLAALGDLAEYKGLRPLDRKLLGTLPSAKEAIAYRYGQGKPLSDVRLAELYTTALGLSVECGRQLARNMKTRGTKFLIRVLPWARSVSPQSGSEDKAG